MARLFGVTHEDAKEGLWWEIDLLLVILAGVLLLAITAWMELTATQSVPAAPAPTHDQGPDRVNPRA